MSRLVNALNTARQFPLLRRSVSIVVQLMVVVLSNRLAFMLRFDGAVPDWATAAFLQMLPWVVAIRALTFVPFRLYQGLWRYTSLYDLQALLGAIASSSVLVFLVSRTPIGPPVYPRSILIIDALLLTLLLGGLRLSRRLYAEFARPRPGKRILVFGAGDAGELIVRDMKNNGYYNNQPIGFIDDDRAKTGRRIHGVPVLGTRADLGKVLARHHADEILLAIPRADPATVRSIVRALEPFKLPIKTLPSLRDLIDGRIEVGHIRSLAVEDLLARAPIGLDPEPVRQLIKGRRVMVTGAGGSIGSELCRQIAKLGPSSLILFERYENSLHAIRMELDDIKGPVAIHPVVGDVADMPCVSRALERFRPELIFHAAAHKHVPLMEENPCEAVKNNVRGTRLLAQAAELFGVDRFILISTDKAVNPTSVMGASKRLAELLVQSQSAGSGTSFSIVRFGNVLASNGSVVPRFLAQIRNGGPVTVTHPDMRRFFMLIPEAVQLVLHAAAQAESGATYVLDMGDQVRVVEMARDLIRLSGYVPDEEIAIEFTGLRPGEKLYEELVGPNEDVKHSAVEKILCVTSRTRPDPHLWSAAEELEQMAAEGDAAGAVASMRRMIPEYEQAAGPATDVAAPQRPPQPREGAVLPQAAVSQPCPACGQQLARSRVRRFPEQLRKGLSARRPFRCGACGWRGWALPLQRIGDGVAEPSDSPDLSSLDQPDAGAAPRRVSFSPKHLQ